MTKIGRYVDNLALIARQVSEQVNSLIDHPGEKGRAAEHIVRGMIRVLLPKKFSIGSGFIVTSDDKRSAQLDIVLFDETVNAPLSLVGDIGVFPVECVYAAIEVKSYLDSAAIVQTAKSIKTVRGFKEHKYYRATRLQIGKDGNSIWEKRIEKVGTLAPRTYLFAFKTSFKTIAGLQRAIERASHTHEAFFHGVIVLNKDWFIFQHATKKGLAKKFSSRTGNAVKEFALKLSKDTIQYPMHAANMERYLGVLEQEE